MVKAPETEPEDSTLIPEPNPSQDNVNSSQKATKGRQHNININLEL